MNYKNNLNYNIQYNLFKADILVTNSKYFERVNSIPASHSRKSCFKSRLGPCTSRFFTILLTPFKNMLK
jgi:hypothetical protein